MAFQNILFFRETVIDSENEYRENLVWKIKKLVDSFELQDDTFFRAVFLYDFQDRFIKQNSESNYNLKCELDGYFIFGEEEEEKQRKWKYIKFFEAIWWLLIAVKFIESDK